MALLRVFACRPLEQNEVWGQTLTQQGFTVLRVPLMQITPLTEVQAIKSLVLDLDQYKKLIFISQNAVRYGMDWIEDYWPQIPLGIEWFAIGTKTQQMLAKRLSQCDSAASNTEVLTGESMHTESLLALPQLQALEHTKVAIFKGLGGRETLADELRARGAQLRNCELYARAKPTQALAQFTQSSLSVEDIVPVFSGESLEYFFEIASSILVDWSKVRVVVPGDRVASLAEKMGFERIYCAQNASENAMLTTLLEVK